VVERALAEGFAGMRLAGEVHAALTRLTPAAYRDVEQRMNVLMRTRPVSALCQYPRATTTGAWLEDVVADHLVGVHQSTFATSEDLDGLALHVEDAANADVLHAVLTAASRNRPRGGGPAVVLCPLHWDDDLGGGSTP
jgi:MEDS: MEthanogen/methylotroph, DcmR Sensory domain